MGQALCACAGRADDEPHRLSRGAKAAAARKRHFAFPFKELSGHDSSLLQTQSRTETRELLSDEEREAIRNSVRVIHASGNFHAHLHHGTGVYGYTLPPDENATESDEAEYYSRQQQNQNPQHGLTLALPARRRPVAMTQATADAFRSKLREPIMSPRSKMVVLVNGASSDDDDNVAQDGDALPETTVRADTFDEGYATAGSPACGFQDETSSDRDLRRLRCESGIYDADPAAADDDDDDDDDEDEEEHFEFARIIVPPGPCGVVFQPAATVSTPPTVEGFVRMYDGSKGPIENSGLVRAGSTLCAINDLDVEAMPLSEVIRALNLSSHLEREFVFRK